MRRLACALLLASAALASCGGDGAPRPATSGAYVIAGSAAALSPVEPDDVAPSLAGGPAASSAAASATPIGLDAFREDLAGLERGQRREHVRVLVFGDSHTAADLWTGSMRKALQSRFGSGGPGFFHVGMSGARHDELKPSQDGHTELLPKAPSTVDRTGDGVLGLGGVLVRPKSKPVTVLVNPRAPFADDLRWELCVRPGTKASRVVLTPRGGAPVIRSFAAGDQAKVVLDRLSTVTRDPHQIEVRIEGDATTCGAIAETDPAKKPGVVLDQLGINGARVATFLARDAASFVTEVRRRDPSLFVVELGGNEAAEETMDPSVFTAELGAFVARIREGAPRASCLNRGPHRAGCPSATNGGDRSAFAQKAAELGCAFWDAQEKLGGPGAMKKMMDELPPRAHADGIHLLERGYRDMAKLTVDDLLRGMDGARQMPAQK